MSKQNNSPEPDASSQEKENLFEEFPPVSLEQWEAQIEKDLKGADYREKLKWKTPEGIDVMPFYRREDIKNRDHLKTAPGRFPFIRGTDEAGNQWEIRHDVFEKEISKANEDARNAIEKGAEGVGFTMEVKRTEGMLGGDLHGVNVQSQDDLKQLLDGIDLEKTTVHFNAGMTSPAYTAMLANEIEQRGIDPKKVEASFLYDPYTFTATSGQLPKKEQAWIKEAASKVKFCQNKMPNVRCLGVDAASYHNAGASAVQEVAIALAIGNEYLAKLTDQGLSVDDITPRLHFNFAVGSSYFMEIAKFRAFRLLWSQVVKQYEPEDLDAAKPFIQVRTSEWNKTVYDSFNNMLRTTTEAMSAAIGGVDVISVEPYDLVYRQPNDFSKRIARNQQLIMKEEAYLNKVADPGAGSYYIEELTDMLAENAWELFKELEQQGGFLKALKGGYVQSEIEKTREQRDMHIAQGRKAFVGTNRYPNPDEEMKDEIGEPYTASSITTTEAEHDFDDESPFQSLSSAFAEGAMLGDIISDLFLLSKHNIQPIRPYRGARPFEDLRLATERYAERQGGKPKVFMLTMGNRRMRKARSTFSSNFFGCAGYEIIDNLGFDTADDAIAEVKEQSPDIVVICSSDKEYPELVSPICDQLKKLKKRPWTVVAGYPEEHIKDFKKAGVDAFIHIKSNVLQELRDFHQRLGIKL